MLAEDLTPEPTPLVFGVVHTDSNQHVNSLVYLRLFEEAVLRSLPAKTGPVLARRLEIAYRKPCFAGDRMRIHTKTFEHEGKRAAIAAIAPEGAPASSAHAVAHMILE